MLMVCMTGTAVRVTILSAINPGLSELVSRYDATLIEYKKLSAIDVDQIGY